MSSREYKYGKLVRDRIPEIATARGETMRYQTVAGKDLYMWLKRKLVEEAYEIAAVDSDQELTEEIGDLLEVVDALIDVSDLKRDAIGKSMQDKYNERGGFREGVVLLGFWRPEHIDE